jgi:NADH-quinone oxidoreductase subunit D
LIDAYENYNLFNFSIPVGEAGDCYDRYLVRLEEMRESLHIMSQSLDLLVYFNHEDNYDYILTDNKITPPPVGFMKYSMSL